MHLSDFPWHVMRRKRHIQPGRNAFPIHRIHIFDPHGHPRTFVARFVPIHLKCSRVRSLAASALRALAKKYLDLFSRVHRSKPRRRSPIPSLLPTPLLKPRETRRNVAHIQYRCNSVCLHAAKSYHRSSQIKLLTRHSERVLRRGTCFFLSPPTSWHSIPSLHRISRVLPWPPDCPAHPARRGFGVCEVPMWRKSEDTKSAPEPASESKPRSNSSAQSASPAAASSPMAATVSRGVIIKGEISGQGDFFLDGTF